MLQFVLELFLLLNSGILKDKKATTYNKNPLRQKMLKDFGAKLEKKAIVVDKNIITSWNPSTAINVAFLLLEKLTNKKNTNRIKKLMGY